MNGADGAQRIQILLDAGFAFLFSKSMLNEYFALFLSCSFFRLLAK